MAKEKQAVVLPSLETDLPRFQTYYNRPFKDKAKVFDPNSSLTDQDYKCMTDVNYLLEHMAGHSRTPLYGVQDNTTFEDWSNEMALLKRRFNDLDPETKKQFANPQEFLNWASDPNNYFEELPTLKYSKKFIEENEKKKISDEEREDRKAKKIAKAIKEG